ncbi:unnamed protein product [Schistocephalus solidus]|uniref:C2 tensin-type domain-containing protein n=1 Tax=Schistocephalus solidus TaxID=70667 RepID=A0A183SQM2_SCHSO|nr:unnamed protein product [Schistocephalus solidus]
MCRVVDCCFDLCGTPDLESMIAFCEVFYDWLALDPRHTVLFHAESAAALQRLLILLYSYACFCDSLESLSDHPGILHLPQPLLYKTPEPEEGCFGGVSPKVHAVFVYAILLHEYIADVGIIIVKPVLVLMACGSTDFEGIGLDDVPQLTPLCLHVDTLNDYKYSGLTHNPCDLRTLSFRFRKNIKISRCIKEYISAYPNGSVRPSVAFLRYAEYMSLFSPYRRMGLLRATMSIHCMAVFNLPLFAESCVRVFFKFYSYSPLRPIYTTATCKVNGKPNNQLVIQFCEAPIMLRGDVVLVCYRLCERKFARQRLFRTNCYVEYTQKTLARQSALRSTTTPLSSLNIIEQGNPSDMELRLADSLEDLAVGNHNAPLPCKRRSHEGLQSFRTKNFSQHLASKKTSFGTPCSGKWNFDASLAKSRLKTAINAAPERPPPPKILGSSCLPRADDGCSLSLNASTHSRESVDSGASFPSHLSATSSNGPERLSNCRDNQRVCSNTLMPPPKTSLLPRIFGKFKVAHQAKTVAFKNPKMAESAGSTRAPIEVMELDDLGSEEQMEMSEAWDEEEEALRRSDFETKFTRLCRLLKTPAGVRGVPTKFFGPPEKARRTMERASATDFRASTSFAYPYLALSMKGARVLAESIINYQKDGIFPNCSWSTAHWRCAFTTSHAVDALYQQIRACFRYRAAHSKNPCVGGGVVIRLGATSRYACPTPRGFKQWIGGWNMVECEVDSGDSVHKANQRIFLT